MFRSSDGGKTWANILYKGPDTGAVVVGAEENVIEAVGSRHNAA